MHNTYAALLWHCMRRTRRWLLIWTLIALAVPTAAFNASPFPAAFIGEPVFMIAFAIASLNAAATMSLWNQAGFPFSYEFRLPISSVRLVILPMLCLCLGCAAIFLIPILLYRVIHDIPFPIAAPVTLLSLLVTVLLCNAWMTTTTTTRGFGFLFILVVFPFLVSAMEPFNVSSRRSPEDPVFNPDVMALSPSAYLVCLLLITGLAGMTVLAVDRQRHGESVTLLRDLRYFFLRNPSQTPESAGEKRRNFFEKLGDGFPVPCPTTSPWMAQVWMETKRYGFPTFMFSLILTIMVPVLILAENLLGWVVATEIAFLTPVLVFFTGVGITLFNRRMASGGFMNALESSRGLDTVQILCIQLGTLAIWLLLGLALIGLSLWATTGLLHAETNIFTTYWQDTFTNLAAYPFWIMTGEVFQTVITLLVLLAFFLCLHSFSVFWGKFAGIVLLVTMVYIISFIVKTSFDATSQESLVRHMWAFSVVIFGASLIGLCNVLKRRLLSPVGGLVLTGILGLYLLCRYASLEFEGQLAADMPAEYLAYLLAVSCLPLMFFLLSLFCYDKLRHG